MRKAYFSLLFVGATFVLPAQEVIWQNDIQSSYQDILSTMTFTPDRQILLSGSSINQESERGKGYDYRIVKLSQDGNLLWEKYYGGSKHDYLSSLIPTRDGGSLLSGTSFSNRSSDKRKDNLGGSDVWIVRLDEDGEEIWQKTLGTKGNDEASAIIQSMDQGFFAAGNILSDEQLFGSKDVFVSKLDENGEPKKTIILGGELQDEITDMIPTPDGGAVLLIYSFSDKSDDIYNAAYRDANKDNSGRNLISSAEVFTGKTENGFGKGDFWIIKLDKDADIEWQKTYGGEDDELPRSVVFTNEGYLIGGEIRESRTSDNDGKNTGGGSDLWILSLDKAGNKLWQNNYSFGKRDVLMSIDVVRQANSQGQNEDKGFLLGGYTEAEETVERDDEKFWILYIDNKGNEEWRKYVEGNSKKKEEHLVSAKLQNDGTYLLVGTSAEKPGQENWKIVKLADKQLEELMEKQDIRIYPNPAKDYCYVEIGFPIEDDDQAEILLYDMSGKRVQAVKTGNTVTKINMSALPPGAYIVTAKTSNKSVNSKILKK